MSTEKKSIFVTDDGKNLMFTFLLVSSLFLLWGLCNGMIDIMDKHFQQRTALEQVRSPHGSSLRITRLLPDVHSRGLGGDQVGI